MAPPPTPRLWSRRRAPCRCRRTPGNTRSWPARCEAIRPNLPLSPNLRGSLFMAVAMAGFMMNDSITKLMSLEMNFGQVMLLRGLFAIVLIGVLAIHQNAIRPLRTLFVKPVALRIVGEVCGTVSFLAA